MSDLELMYNPETGKWREAPKYKLDIYFESKSEMEECYEKLIEGKYEWHDLQENPNDLPIKEYDAVQVWLKGRVVDIAIYDKNHGFRPWYAAFFECGTPEWDDENAVIAWKYIEPFKEAQDETK